MFTLKNKISMLSVSTRGLRDLTKRKGIFSFLTGKRVFFFSLLQETHSSKEVSFWAQQWDSYFSHDTLRSAGVAILINNFPSRVIAHSADDGHWLFLIIIIDKMIIILLNFYGYNKKRKILKISDELT